MHLLSRCSLFFILALMISKHLNFYRKPLLGLLLSREPLQYWLTKDSTRIHQSNRFFFWSLLTFKKLLSVDVIPHTSKSFSTLRTPRMTTLSSTDTPSGRISSLLLDFRVGCHTLHFPNTSTLPYTTHTPSHKHTHRATLPKHTPSHTNTNTQPH